MVNKRFQLVILVMALVLGLTVVGCDDGSTNKETKTIDSRLVGGNWSLAWSTHLVAFYRFTETSYGIASNGEATIILTPAYTESGKVMASDSHAVLLNYEFVPSSRYDNEMAAAISSGNQQEMLRVQTLQWLANSGNMVKFTIPGSSQSIEWARWENLP